MFILKLTFCELCVKSGIYCFLQLWTSSVTVTLMKHIFYRHGFIQQYNYDLAGGKYYSGLKYLWNNVVTLNGAQLSAFQVVLIFTSSIHDLITYNMTAVEEVAIYEIIQFPSYTKRHDKLAVVVAFDSREKLGVRATSAFLLVCFFR